MRIVIVSLLCIFTLSASAQNRLSDKIYFGGGGGLSVGSNQTNISVFPQVGYKITQNYSAGVGITYQYVRLGEPFNQSLSNYGWSIFNRYNITRQFFAYAEYERLNYEFFFTSTESTDRFSNDALFVGGGYSEAIGGRSAFNVMVLYNVLYDEADVIQPYNSPWAVRAGVGIGIF